MPLHDLSVLASWRRAFVRLRPRVRSPCVARSTRIAVAISLMVLLFVGADGSTVLAHVRQLSPGIVALIVLALAVQLTISSWKWQWALRIHGLRFRYVFLTRVLFIAFFLNNFLPTSIGGDAYRIYRTLPAEPPKSRAISAVLLERIVGVCALLVLGLAGALALHSSSELARVYVGLTAAGAALAIGLFLLLNLGRSAPRGDEHSRSPWLSPVRENLRSVAAARTEWIPLIGLSLLFQAQAILIVWGLFDALDAHVTLAQAALITAAAGIAAVIPLSINGLGIVEATYAGTAIAVGVSYEAGLLVALLIRILVIPLTLLAGLLYAFEPVQLREISSSVTNIRSPG